MNLRNFLKTLNYNYDSIILENVKTNRTFYHLNDYLKNKNVVATIYSFFTRELIVYIN